MNRLFAEISQASVISSRHLYVAHLRTRPYHPSTQWRESLSAREKRKLAAIVAADVVGYSRLMGRDEAGTVARLRLVRAERLEPVLARRGGRIVKLTGDGALIEFASAVEALSAAIEFQQAMAESETAHPEAERLVFRVGVHLGDVIVDGDDLYGDGVNVAARLEAAAPAGGIAISGDMHNLAARRVAATFDDLGRLALKNIDRPIQAYNVHWQAADWRISKSAEVEQQETLDPAAVSAGTGLPLPDKPSIAVLPFHNMSGDPEQEYFADGIADDIITELSRFRELFVIARNSSFTYKGRSVDVRQIARELGVRYVLEGSCRKAGNRVRVSAQLVACESGSHIWAERYDSELADIFSVQETIARSIVASIAPAIGAEALARIRRLAPANLTAHALVTRAWSEGFAAYLSGEASARDRTLATARQALQLDPECARAWATVAATAWMSEFYSRRESTPETCREGLEAARKAIAYDRLDHSGYMYKGLLHLQLLQYEDALSDLRQACELNPNDVSALQSLAYAELVSGDATKAKAHCLEVLRLNPRDPFRYNVYSLLANVCFLTAEYAEGLKWVADSRREHPDFPPTTMTAIKLYVGLGQVDLAKVEADRVRRPQLEAQVRAGISNLRRAEDREREVRFLRIGFGLSNSASAEVAVLGHVSSPCG